MPQSRSDGGLSGHPREIGSDQIAVIDFMSAVWRKSTRSQGGGDACVEVANLDGVVAVRDSKDPSGPPLVFNRQVWAVFANAAKTGQLDR